MIGTSEVLPWLQETENPIYRQDIFMASSIKGDRRVTGGKEAGMGIAREKLGTICPGRPLWETQPWYFVTEEESYPSLSDFLQTPGLCLESCCLPPETVSFC